MVRSVRRRVERLVICAVVVCGVGAAGLMLASSAAAATTSNTLSAGHVLSIGQQLVSADGRYRAVIQSDGNFVVYGPRGVVWAAFSPHASGAVLAMQSDGNLVVYAGGRPTWNAGTQPTTADRLVMQSDGNLVVYTGAGKAVWVNGHHLTTVASTAGTRIIAEARKFVGYPYVYGAAGPGAFDCSGYTEYVYRAAGVANLYHNSETQRHQVRIIPASQARAGDLMFYLAGGAAYHVAIYAGAGHEYSAAEPGVGVIFQAIWGTNIQYGTDWH